jgi:hypothetical protein
MNCDCEVFLTKLCNEISDLAENIHRRGSWADYEDIITEVEQELKNHSDCEPLRKAYSSLLKQYEIMKEQGNDGIEDALLDIANEIIEEVI